MNFGEKLWGERAEKRRNASYLGLSAENSVVACNDST